MSRERALGVIRAYVDEERRANTPFNTLNADAVEAFILDVTGAALPPWLTALPEPLPARFEHLKERKTAATEKPPTYMCGPTCGCGKAMDMVPAENVFPPCWKLPEKCPNCGQPTWGNVFIYREKA